MGLASGRPDQTRQRPHVGKEAEQPLHKAPLPTTDEIFSSDKYEVEYSKEKLREGGFSILTAFLSILGVGVDVGADWKHRYACLLTKAVQGFATWRSAATVVNARQ